MDRALRYEIAKLRRSRAPLWSLLVVVGWPLWSIFTVRLSSGSLDQTTWRAFMTMGAQEIASWYGVILGGFVASYVFGREYGEGTMHAMLTQPVRREWFVISKLVVVLAWVGVLAALSVAAHAAYATLLGLDGFAWRYLTESLQDTMLVALVIAATLPLVGWIAVLGRGYLAPMIFSVAAFFFAVLFLQVGWGRWYPWAMPWGIVDMLWLPGGAHTELVAGSWVILAGCFTLGLAGLLASVDFLDCPE